MNLRHGVALLMLAIVSTSVPAQVPPGLGRVIGVFDANTGQPLSGVQVRDAFTGNYVMTSASGAATLSFLSFRGGAAIVQLRKLGYDPKQVIVSREDTVSLTELMEPVTTLAPVVTTERYRIDRDLGKWEGFEQRCQETTVTCFRASDIDARPSANLADFFIRAKGVTIGACGGGGGPGKAKDSRATQCGKVSMHSNTIPPAYCQPTFFIDGFEWNPVSGVPTDLVPGEPPQAPFTPANVKAVEVYPPAGGRPSRFNGDPNCGAIVIWTK